MSTAVTAQSQDALPAADSSGEKKTALPLRNDTFLGVCEAVGTDLGFHPNWLRIPFAALILWNPVVIVASYLGLGCVVAVSRWLFPTSDAKAAPKLESSNDPDSEADEEELAIAA